jgi:hypothetical protein
VIGGTGGNVIRSLGSPTETPDEELTPQALLIRKLRRALSGGDRRPIAVLKGQRAFDGREVE